MRKNIVAIFSVVILSLTCAVFANAQTNTNTNPPQTADKKLKILKKPAPESGRCSQSSGMTMVKVTFDKSAKVTDAVVTKPSGCDRFDENSLKAARKIKFEPQTKDGEPITVTKQVEYRYFRY